MSTVVTRKGVVKKARGRVFAAARARGTTAASVLDLVRAWQSAGSRYDARAWGRLKATLSRQRKASGQRNLFDA